MPAVALGDRARHRTGRRLAISDRACSRDFRILTWIVFLYLIPTTFLFHNFWAVQGADRIDAMIHFEKNLAIMGGLVLLAAFGVNAYSDRQRPRGAQ